MHKLRIGVFLDKSYRPSVGGGFSYAEQLIQFLDEYPFDERLELFFISEDIHHKGFKKKLMVMPSHELESKAWTFTDKWKYKWATLFSNEEKKRVVIQTVRERTSLAKRNWLLSQSIDLVYYTHPTNHPPDVPYIMTHWDLGHRTIFPFPEIAEEGNFSKRIQFHSNHLAKAFAIFAESEQSKEELIQYERIHPDRIFVVPLFPGKVAQLNVAEAQQKEILEKWKLKKGQYFYYPAQYWAHKNHFVLIEAFSKIAQIQPQAKLIFSGSDKGNKRYLQDIALQLGIQDRIIFEGFISNEEVYSLYKNAAALVMPTFLGPTNMPLLEARDIGCPIICSDLSGHRRQMQNDARYFSPTDTQALASLLTEAIIDYTPRNASSKNYKESTCKLIEAHLLHLLPIRKTWK